MSKVPIPTRLVDHRRVKRSGSGGPRIKEYQDEHGNWYTNIELGVFYNVPAGTIRNRIDKNGYNYKYILQGKVKSGYQLDGSKRNTTAIGTDAGNAEWQSMKG